MPKNFSAKYYQENKEKEKEIKIFQKKKKNRSNNMVVNVTKVS